MPERRERPVWYYLGPLWLILMPIFVALVIWAHILNWIGSLF